MKKKIPNFVALFHETIDTPAWRALTPSARMLYAALKRKLNLNYEKNNNGQIYLAHRHAARELGFGKNRIWRWYSELQFYGFIVMAKPAGLGANGKGRAAKWRLTEWECDSKPATRDFLKWDGKKFNKRPYRQLQSRQKKCPPRGGHPVPPVGDKGKPKVSPRGGQRARPPVGDIIISKPSVPSLDASLDDRRQPKTSRPTESACGWGVGQPSDPGPCRSRSREAHPHDHRHQRQRRRRRRRAPPLFNRTNTKGDET
jgi:hypothetical protein